MTLMLWPELLLISKFPSFDPSWSTDVQLNWFEMFEKIRVLSAQVSAGCQGGS